MPSQRRFSPGATTSSLLSTWWPAWLCQYCWPWKTEEKELQRPEGTKLVFAHARRLVVSSQRCSGLYARWSQTRSTGFTSLPMGYRPIWTAFQRLFSSMASTRSVNSWKCTVVRATKAATVCICFSFLRSMSWRPISMSRLSSPIMMWSMPQRASIPCQSFTTSLTSLSHASFCGYFGSSVRKTGPEELRTPLAPITEATILARDLKESVRALTVDLREKVRILVIDLKAKATIIVRDLKDLRKSEKEKEKIRAYLIISARLRLSQSIDWQVHSTTIILRLCSSSWVALMIWKIFLTEPSPCHALKVMIKWSPVLRLRDQLVCFLWKLRKIKG